jgi:hypothetical protein
VLYENYTTFNASVGTGKSYFGARIASVLVGLADDAKFRRKSGEPEDSAKEVSGPILVVTYKNHALDEMLLDVAKLLGGDAVGLKRSALNV